MPDKPILVAGGGIGGLSAALGLARNGFSVIVLERSAELGEIGAGIQLGPNAFMLSTRWAWATPPGTWPCSWTNCA